jgi:hypothetical protein
MIAISALHHETEGKKKNPAADLIDKLLAIPKGRSNGREHARAFACSSMSLNLATLRHQIRAIPLSHHHPWGIDKV